MVLRQDWANHKSNKILPRRSSVLPYWGTDLQQLLHWDCLLWVRSIGSCHTRLPSEKYGQAETLGHLRNGLTYSHSLCKKFCPALGLELPGLRVLAMGWGLFLYVIVNFMHQFNRTIGCPHGWWNIILVCLWGCFWMRLAFESSRLSKANCLPQCEWALLNLPKAWIERKGWPSPNKRKFFLPTVSWDIGLFLPSDSSWNPGFSGVPSLVAFGPRLYHELSRAEDYTL